MADPVSWNLQLAVREGRLQKFEALMREMVTSAEAEPGTIGYEWFLSEDGSTCHLHERFTDSGAALTHLGNFGSKFADRFLDCVEPTGLSVYGEPSAEARQALDGFGAKYLGTFGGFSR